MTCVSDRSGMASIGWLYRVQIPRTTTAAVSISTMYLSRAQISMSFSTIRIGSPPWNCLHFRFPLRRPSAVTLLPVLVAATNS